MTRPPELRWFATSGRSHERPARRFTTAAWSGASGTGTLGEEPVWVGRGTETAAEASHLGERMGFRKWLAARRNTEHYERARADLGMDEKSEEGNEER